jgi:hypothetical protein
VKAAVLDACNEELPLVWDVGVLIDAAGLAQVLLFIEPVYLELADEGEGEEEILAGLQLAAAAAVASAGLVEAALAGAVDVETVIKEAPVLGAGSLSLSLTPSVGPGGK